MAGKSFDLFTQDTLETSNEPFPNAVSPQREALAYEKLYSVNKMSFTKISHLLKGTYPSIIWENHYKDNHKDIEENVNTFFMHIIKRESFIIGVKNCSQFPTESINNFMDYPVPVLYSKGNVDLLDSDFKKDSIYISIVGTRKMTNDGRKRTQRLVKGLKDVFSRKLTIISGLARGIDTVALSTAIENSVSVIGVVGTPVHKYYPKENVDLQDTIAREHLLVSHVPFYKHHMEPFSARKFHFTERNSIMAAISDATIVVEASETSGDKNTNQRLSETQKAFVFS